MKGTIFGAIGISAVSAVLVVVGCGDGNPVNPGVGSKLSVNGAQVYGLGALKSNYTGSFTYFDGPNAGPLASSFTNPVVKMTNGKLTVNLDKPTAGLIPIRDFLEEVDKPTSSDSTAEIFQISYLGGDCDYDGIDDYYNCGSGLIINNVADPDYEYVLLYADRDVTFGGNIKWCDWDNDNDECVYFWQSILFDLKKGWNAVGAPSGERMPDNNMPFIKYSADISGSGNMKWYLHVYGEHGDDYSHLDIPAPTGTPIPLISNAWTDGNITSTAFGTAAWYSFDVMRGGSYHVYWNHEYTGDKTKTLRAIVSAVYSGGPSIFINEYDGWYEPPWFTADTAGTVHLRVTPRYPGDTGTFAIAFNTSGTRPGVPALNKSVATDSCGNAVKQQKRLKDRRVNNLFKRL
jgi:hypothetical protein